jgi:Ion channel.
VTLTTVGYGDICPSSAVARWLVWVQAVFGQFYMAVFVARLIGMQVPASVAGPADAAATSLPRSRQAA